MRRESTSKRQRGDRRGKEGITPGLPREPYSPRGSVLIFLDREPSSDTALAIDPSLLVHADTYMRKVFCSRKELEVVLGLLEASMGGDPREQLLLVHDLARDPESPVPRAV